MNKRLLLLRDDEAEFLTKALELWVIIHAGEEGPEVDAGRVDRFHVSRKIDGKYTDEEREEVAKVALEMVG